MEMKTFKSKYLYEIYKNILNLCCLSIEHPDLIGKRYVIEYDEQEDEFILMYYTEVK